MPHNRARLDLDLLLRDTLWHCFQPTETLRRSEKRRSIREDPANNGSPLATRTLPTAKLGGHIERCGNRLTAPPSSLDGLDLCYKSGFAIVVFYTEQDLSTRVERIVSYQHGERVDVE